MPAPNTTKGPQGGFGAWANGSSPARCSVSIGASDVRGGIILPPAMIQPCGWVWDKLRFAVFQVLALEGGQEGFWRDPLLLDFGPCLESRALCYFPGVG